jgi:hypothetical protein
MVRDADMRNWLNTRLNKTTKVAEAEAAPAGAPAKPAPTAPPKGRPGRKPGSGAIDDGAAIEDMRRLLAAGSCPSIWAAAGQLAGQSEAARRRLNSKFRKQFGTSPPVGKPRPTSKVN